MGLASRYYFSINIFKISKFIQNVDSHLELRSTFLLVLVGSTRDTVHQPFPAAFDVMLGGKINK